MAWICFSGWFGLFSHSTNHHNLGGFSFFFFQVPNFCKSKILYKFFYKSHCLIWKLAKKNQWKEDRFGFLQLSQALPTTASWTSRPVAWSSSRTCCWPDTGRAAALGATPKAARERLGLEGWHVGWHRDLFVLVKRFNHFLFMDFVWLYNCKNHTFFSGFCQTFFFCFLDSFLINHINKPFEMHLNAFLHL